MTETMKPDVPKAKAMPERTPIPIDKLLFSAGPIVGGVKLPAGPKGETDQTVPFLKSGMSGDIRTEIELRPWMRMYRVTRTKRIERTDKGKQVVTFEPVGKPYLIPETMAVAVLAEDL